MYDFDTNFNVTRDVRNKFNSALFYTAMKTGERNKMYIAASGAFLSDNKDSIQARLLNVGQWSTSP